MFFKSLKNQSPSSNDIILKQFKGRLLLTTHRLITTVNPYRQDAPIKSLSAPFAAIVKCSVEQPIFGANYIEATVRDETDRNKTFSFKLKFPKGGAIEIAMTMNRAVARVGQVQQSQPMAQPPPTYNPSPAAQYYQAPPNVYAPGYNCGVQVPVQQFPGENRNATNISIYPIIVPFVIPF